MPKPDKHHKLDERNHVEKPLLEQLAGLAWVSISRTRCCATASSGVPAAREVRRCFISTSLIKPAGSDPYGGRAFIALQRRRGHVFLGGGFWTLPLPAWERS